MRAVPGIDRVEQRYAQIVDEAEALERFRQLEAAREPEPRALIGGQAVQPPPVEGDAAAVVVQYTGKAVDERAFAGAVGADQAEPLSGLDSEVDAFERDEAAKAFAEPAHFEDRFGHQRILVRQR